jgi:hypothetical protein
MSKQIPKKNTKEIIILLTSYEIWERIGFMLEKMSKLSLVLIFNQNNMFFVRHESLQKFVSVVLAKISGLII